MFNQKTLYNHWERIRVLERQVRDLYEQNEILLKKVDESEVKINKLINQQKKSEQLFIEALNEQRLRITQCIEVIKYLCNINNVKLINKKENNKKNKKKEK